MDWIINWWPATVLGPIVLGGVIAYAMLTRRRLSRSEKHQQKKAIRRLYRNKDRDGSSVK